MNNHGNSSESLSRSSNVGRYALVLASVWTLLLAGSFLWFYHQEQINLFEDARAQARTALESGFLYRKWVSSQGGIYVASNSNTPPNPLLDHVPERDITTPSGKTLTLVNAAYLARLVHEFAEREKFSVAGEKLSLKGHLTSLNPTRKQNAPDPWEEKSLQKFEQGAREASEIMEINGAPHMRVMRASMVIASCLKCHPDYKVGDVLGGISFSMPLTLHLESTRKKVLNGAATHGLILLTGLGIIGFGRRRLINNMINLERSEEQFRNLSSLAPIGITLLDSDGRNRYVNPRWSAMTGFDGNVGTGNLWSDVIHLEDRELVNASWRKTVASGGNWSGEYRFVSSDGQASWIYGVLTPTFDNAERVNGYIGIHIDITGRKLAEAETFKLSQAVTQSPIAMVITDATGRAEFVNPEFERATGYPAEEFIGETFGFLDSGENGPEVFRELWETISSGAIWQGELKNRKKTGEIFWCTETIAPIKNKRGETSHYVVVIEDINDRKFAEATIQKLAFYDPLTELPNRRLLMERLRQTMMLAKREGSKVALFYLDIDNFKMVNDTLGHSVGDLLLKAASERFAGSIRESDILARLGGDEFALVMTQIGNTADSVVMAEKLMESIKAPIQIGKRDLYLTVSVGISLYPDDTDQIDDLIRYADVAMYEAKGKGRNSFQFFSSALNKRFEEMHFIGISLRQSLTRNEFFLCYQPKMRLDTGRIYGMEALIRWNHPENGLIPPEKFIPIAEENLEIIKIGYWVLETACRETMRLNALGHELKVSVNLSPVQFHQPDLCTALAGLLAEIGMPPQLLELEITESALAKVPEEAVKVINIIRKMGVAVSIDDFGTGYSSLSQLRNFPVNTLKIDSSFIRDICTERSAFAISTSIITLAHSLDLEVVAEGVETTSQLQLLKEMGCDSIQGYLLGKPVSSSELIDLLKTHTPA